MSIKIYVQDVYQAVVHYENNWKLIDYLILGNKHTKYYTSKQQNFMQQLKMTFQRIFKDLERYLLYNTGWREKSK